METTSQKLTEEDLNNEIQELSKMLFATRIEDVQRIKTIANRLTNLVSTETEQLSSVTNNLGRIRQLIEFAQLDNDQHARNEIICILEETEQYIYGPARNDKQYEGFSSSQMEDAFNAGVKNHADDLEGNAQHEDATQWLKSYNGARV